MPHWLTAIVAAATFLASWRWIIRPIRRWAREALAMLREIRESARERRALSVTQHELAGAMVTLAMTMTDQHNETARRVDRNTERLNDLSELVVDLAADFRRHQRDVHTTKKDPTTVPPLENG